MSLNQKYTWNDFLKENPQFKEKKVKRTSTEGKKAFETAYKAKIKDILKDRLVWIEKEGVRVAEKKSGLVTEINATKRGSRRTKIQSKIGAADKYLHKLGKVSSRTKQIQKSF